MRTARQKHLDNAQRILEELDEVLLRDTNHPRADRLRTARDAEMRLAHKKATVHEVRETWQHDDLVSHARSVWGPNACTSIDKGTDGRWRIAVFANKTEDDTRYVEACGVPGHKWLDALAGLMTAIVGED